MNANGIIHVVIWSYGDGSGFGVVRAFRHAEDAEDLKTILSSHSTDRSFDIMQTDLVDEVLP